MFRKPSDEAFRFEPVPSIGSMGGVKLAVSMRSWIISETLRVAAGELSCAADPSFDLLTFTPVGPVEADFDFSMTTPAIAVAEKITRNNAIFLIVIKDSPSTDSLILLQM